MAARTVVVVVAVELSVVDSEAVGAVVLATVDVVAAVAGLCTWVVLAAFAVS